MATLARVPESLLSKPTVTGLSGLIGLEKVSARALDDTELVDTRSKPDEVFLEVVSCVG